MQYLPYILTLLLPLLAVSCSATSVPAADFSLPEKTLKTFQEAFGREDVVLEYDCFSLLFKKQNGNFGLDNYYEFRSKFVDEHPVAAFLFSINDLTDNITIRSPLKGMEWASLTLEVAGEEIIITFILETTYRLEYLEARPEEDLLLDPHTRILEKEGQLEINLPMTPRTRKHLGDLKKILVEKRWKFLEFSFQNEKMSVSG